MKIFDKVLYGGVMTLGDCIVCNAIVHRFAKESNILYYPTDHTNFETLSCLYQDYDNIVVVTFDGPQQEQDFISKNNLMRIRSADIYGTYINRVGTSGGMNVSINWDRQIYEYYDLPYSTRYTGFKFPKNVEGSQELYNELTQGDDNYVLFHQEASYGSLNINLDGFRMANGMPPLKVIEVKFGTTKNLCQYIKLIENAKEIHCIPSSFYCLVDSLFDRVSGELFFHDRRANGILQINCKWNDNKWNMVHYESKV
jgi:hypothetical protein